jgi:2-polyprenyl-3-methyl-5-hydroxy-6-metoxy-1,4-benzoquinol methylase
MPLLSGSLTHARLSRVRKYLGKQILDIGCGYGNLLDYLPAGVERIVLLDCSPDRQTEVKKRLTGTKIRADFLIENIDQPAVNLNFEPFDTVVMSAVLEHLKFPEIALGHVHKILCPNGRLVLTTPLPVGGKLHWLGSYLGLTYAEAAREHERFYDSRALQWLLKKKGFWWEHYERFLVGLNQLVVARKQ